MNYNDLEIVLIDFPVITDLRRFSLKKQNMKEGSLSLGVYMCNEFDRN